MPVTVEFTPTEQRGYRSKLLVFTDGFICTGGLVDLFGRGVAHSDLCITPWGHALRNGSPVCDPSRNLNVNLVPEWKSPDIVVIDDAGNETNAEKGIVNRLRASVYNIGPANTRDYRVVFKFAPWFVGISESHKKTIDTRIEIDLLPQQTRQSYVLWDLSGDYLNLDEGDNGVWPGPVRDFEHFCVTARIEYFGDPNQANNSATTNFFDVGMGTQKRLYRFIVGNPFEYDVEAELTLSGLPKGFEAELLEFRADKFRQPFKLKPTETTLATLLLSPPLHWLDETPNRDEIVDIGLDISGKHVSGLSMRLFKASDA